MSLAALAHAEWVQSWRFYQWQTFVGTPKNAQVGELVLGRVEIIWHE